MITERNQLFRKTALARLSSPNQLDERLKLLSYRPWVVMGVPVLVVFILIYAFWLLGAS